jgi:hypothetical protein
VAKTRKASRKSAAKKKRKPARRVAKKAAPRGVDFTPVKKQLAAHIAKFEKKYGTEPLDPDAAAKLTRLRAVSREMTDICFPSMILEFP